MGFRFKASVFFRFSVDGDSVAGLGLLLLLGFFLLQQHRLPLYSGIKKIEVRGLNCAGTFSQNRSYLIYLKGLVDLIMNSSSLSPC